MKKKAAALQYERVSSSAPKVTAKGEGVSAENIIKIAKLHDIPIQEDADLIELLSNVELDHEIPAEMYKAVAEVFSFIYKTTKKE
jgi:flagellar biosynthesis protein